MAVTGKKYVSERLSWRQLAARWGQQVLIEARPGAGGLIAGQAVANAPADGYTLVGGPASLFTILPAQKEKLPIDVSRDFAQIGMIVGSGSVFIAVTPKLGVSTFPEFVALAKSRPGQIAIGTNGAGTLPHFSGLVLEKKGGVPITVVPGGRGSHRPLRRGRSSCRHRLDARAVSAGGQTPRF